MKNLDSRIMLVLHLGRSDRKRCMLKLQVKKVYRNETCDRIYPILLFLLMVKINGTNLILCILIIYVDKNVLKVTVSHIKSKNKKT